MDLPLAFVLATVSLAAGGNSPEVTVTGHRFENTRAAVEAISPNVSQTEPLARFFGTVCVSSSGLPKEANRHIVARVEDIASGLGLNIGKPGCQANIVILFVPDGKKAVQDLSAKGSPSLSSQSPSSIRRILKEAGAGRGWIETEVRSRDGDRIHYKVSSAPELSLATSSQMTLPIRRDIVSSVVMIDRDAVAGLNINRVAEYAAFRALTGVHSDGWLNGQSIMSLFTKNAAYSPDGMTQFDEVYLKVLYNGKAGSPSAIKKSEISRNIELVK